MQSRMGAIFVLVLVVLAFSQALSGQFAPPSGEEGPLPKDAKPAPRLPDGKPDLRGVWNLGFGSSYFSRRTSEMAQQHRYGRTNAAQEAMKPAMREKYKAQLEAGKARDIDRDLLDPVIKACAPHSPSGALQRGLPLEIIQLPDRVIFRFEEDHWVRQVWMDGRGHPQNRTPTWMGHSMGRWDGDTLVVETVAMDALTWLDSPGHPHTENLRLVERYTRVSDNRLDVQVTFYDPEIYTQPLVGNTQRWRLLPDGEIGEWVGCENRIRINLETEPCKIVGAWQFDDYCKRSGPGHGKRPPQEKEPSGAP